MAGDTSSQKYKPTTPVDLYEGGHTRRVDDQPVSLVNEDKLVPSSVDDEIGAMKKIVDAIRGLNSEEQKRVLEWAFSRFVL